MNNQNRTKHTCTATLKLLGDYWTLRIIDTLSMGESRFCELQRSLDNVNPVTLTNRLKHLEQAGILSRSEDAGDKIAVTYSLTRRGTEVLPIIKALDTFARNAKSQVVMQ